MYTVTCSSRLRNFDALYKEAGRLQLGGWNVLVPVLESGDASPDNTITFYEYTMNTLLEEHYDKINKSDALYVHFENGDSFADYKDTKTLKELRYAIEKDKDIYFSYHLPNDLLPLRTGDERYIPQLDSYCTKALTSVCGPRTAIMLWHMYFYK